VKEPPDLEQTQPELLRLAVIGDADSWIRVQELLFQVLDGTLTRLSTLEASSGARTETNFQLTNLADEWAQMRVSVPSLESERARSEIMANFAAAKHRLAEAYKTEMEGRAIAAQTASRELAQLLDNLERIMRLINVMAKVKFVRVGEDAEMCIGTAWLKPVVDAQSGKTDVEP
jgi:hypothetical protein